MTLEAILAFLQTPLGGLVLALVTAYLSKAYPPLANILHRVLDALGLKVADPKAIKEAQLAAAVQAEASNQAQSQLATAAIAAWTVGDKDRAAKMLDAAALLQGVDQR